MQPESITTTVPPGPAHPPTPPAAPTATPPQEPAPRLAPTNAQYLLGLFILWQVFFLFASNFLAFVKDIQKNTEYVPRDWVTKINRIAPGLLEKKGHVHDAFEEVRGLTKRWAEFSCQHQGWSLFAPNVGRDMTFVAVELRWDEPGRRRAVQAEISYVPELLLSINEPKNPARYLRWGMFRLRKYEGYLDVVLRVQGDETLDEAAERWRGLIKDKVDEEKKCIYAYLRARLRAYKEEHPDRPTPKQVILLVRCYHIPQPENFSTDWYVPDMVPLARWRPTVETEVNFPIESYRPTPLNPQLRALLRCWPLPRGGPIPLAVAGYFDTHLAGDRFEKP